MTKFTKEMKEKFLAIQTGDEYMSFINQYLISGLDFAQDKELTQKLEELIRMASGSCGDGTGIHMELRKKKK